MSSGPRWQSFNPYGMGGSGQEGGAHNLSDAEQGQVAQAIQQLEQGGYPVNAGNIASLVPIAENRVSLFLQEQYQGQQAQGSWGASYPGHEHQVGDSGLYDPGAAGGTSRGYSAAQDDMAFLQEQYQRQQAQRSWGASYPGQPHQAGNYPAQEQPIPLSRSSTLANALGPEQASHPRPPLVSLDAQPTLSGVGVSGPSEQPFQRGDPMGADYRSDPDGAIDIYQGHNTPAGFDDTGLPPGYAFDKQKKLILGPPRPDPNEPGQQLRYARKITLSKSDTEGNQKSRGKFLRAINEAGMTNKNVSGTLGKGPTFLGYQNRILPEAFKRPEISKQESGRIGGSKAGRVGGAKVHQKKDADGKSIHARKAAFLSGVSRSLARMNGSDFANSAREARRGGLPETGRGQLELLVSTVAPPRLA